MHLRYKMPQKRVLRLLRLRQEKAGLERVKKTSKRVVETKVERISFGYGCDPQLLPFSEPRRSVIAAEIEPPGRQRIDGKLRHYFSGPSNG
jgi:hypothetical protein